MRMRWGMVVGVALMGLGNAGAQGRAAEDTSEPGYCDFVRGVGESESAQQLAPSVFINVGMVNAGEAGSERGVPLGGPTPRLTAGVAYDFVGLYRAYALHQQAEAECTRYRAFTSLRAVVRQGADLGSRAAMEARAEVLRTALPEAEQLMASLREEVQHGRATIEELNVLELRLDALRSLAHDTERERARLSALRPLTSRPLSQWLAELRTADARVEQEASALRRSSALSVQLRGGYDELIRLRQDVPFFGTFTVSYNLGALWQGTADTRAQHGRALALEQDVDGVNQDVELLVRELRAAHSVEEARLREVTMLVTDLEQQLEEVKAMETSKVRRYRCYLMLELTRLSAERAWLAAHVAEVGRFLDEGTP